MLKYLKQLNEVDLKNPAKIFPGLNGAKGLLILMVVLTHCLPPSMAHYFMYAFHMPLFMAISGFLLKESVFDKGYYHYFKHVTKRLIIPWLIARIIFLPFKGDDIFTKNWKFTEMLYPYHHLWYIPAYILGATICYWIITTKISPWIVMLFFAIVTVFWYNVYRDTHVDLENLPLYWLGDKRFYCYLLFMILGFCVRNMLVNISISPTLLILMQIVALGILLAIIKHSSSWITVWPYMLLNISLVLFILMYVAPQNWLQNKFLLYINSLSLGIYLYHPLMIKSIYWIIGDRTQTHIGNIKALGVFFIALALTLGFLWLLKKWWFTDRYFLGNVKRQ